MNVWRPIRTVTRDALAVCDARSIPDSRLREITNYFRNPATTAPRGDKADKAWANAYTNKADIKSYEVMPPEQPGTEERDKWYYASRMKPDEALLLKIFDSSKRADVAKRCPHTSFQCEQDSGPPRQSVEVRCLVFWEDQK